MKIGIIVRKLDTNGGVQRQALSLARELSARGHDIRLYTFRREASCFPELIGTIPVVELPRELHRPTGGFFGFVGEARMARSLALLMDPELEILHPHDVVAHYVAHYYKKLVKKIPSVWYMNELPSSRWPLELLTYVEDPRYHDVSSHPLWFRKMSILARTSVERFFARSQDAILLLSTFHIDLAKRYLGRKGTIVFSGVDADSFPFVKHELPVPGTTVELLSSGIFLAYRRYEDLIEALPILRKKGIVARLTILGGYETDKKYHRELVALADRLGVGDNVIYHGRYSDAELLSFFAKSHVFVFPHLQVQGLSVYESIVAGLPSVVTPLPGTYETLVNREHVMTAKPKDPEDLARAIAELISNPTLYQKLSDDASRYVREHITWRAYADGVLRALEAALAKKKG